METPKKASNELWGMRTWDMVHNISMEACRRREYEKKREESLKCVVVCEHCEDENKGLLTKAARK